MLWFQRDRSENLHPDFFNCRRCDRPEKDIYAKPVECPRCPLTEKLEFYKAEILRLIKEKVGRFSKDYTLPELIALHGTMSSILFRRKDRIGLAMDTRTARLAEILLSERRHMKSLDDWEHRQRMKQK